MQVGSRGSFLSRFIGLMHIPEYVPRLTVDYDPDDFSRTASADNPDKPLPPVAAPEFDDIDRAPSPAPAGVPQDEWAAFGRSHAAPVAPIHSPHVKDVPPAQVFVSHISEPGGGGGADDLRIDVTYQPGGDEDDVRIVQANALRSDDVVTAGSEPPAWPDHHAPALQTVEDTATLAMPEAYAHTSLNSPDSITA